MSVSPQAQGKNMKQIFLEAMSKKMKGKKEFVNAQIYQK